MCPAISHVASCVCRDHMRHLAMCMHSYKYMYSVPMFMLQTCVLTSTCVPQVCLLTTVASPPAEEHTCDCHNLALLLQQLHQVELVSWRAPSKHLHEQ